MSKDKQKIEELEAQLEQYQNILGNLHEGYILVDENAVIHDVNPAYCEMVGYTRDELLSMKITDVRPGMSLEYQHKFIKDTISRGSKEFETQHLHKNGHFVDLNASAATIKKDGKIFMAGFVRNVTEEKRKHRKLKQSERRYRSLFKHNPHSVYLMDLQGQYIGLNKKMEELTGFTKEELLSKNFASLICDEDLSKTQDNFERAAQGEVRNYTITGIMKGGTRKRVQVSNFPMIVEGEITGVFGIAEDLTEKDEAEQKRRESEQRLKSLFEHNPNPVYQFDLDGNFVDVNDQMVEFSGYSKEELLQLGLKDVIIEKDIEEAQKHFIEAVKGNSSIQEMTVEVKSGKKKEIRSTKFPMYIDGYIAGVYGIVQDITEQKKTAKKLKQSEQRWEKLVETSPLPIQVVGTDGIIVYINKAGANLYGYKNPNEVIGKSLYSFNEPKIQDRIKERVASMADGVSVDHHDHSIINKDGEKRFVEVHSIGINYNGEKAVQSIYRDVTEQKNAEKKLKESEERWHRLVEENPKAVQITVDGEIIFINEAGVKLYEADSSDDLVGASVYDYAHPEDLEEVKERKQRLENRHPIDQVHVNRLITNKGNERFIEVHSVPIKYKGKQAIQTNIYDITERKKEEELIQASLKEKQILLQEIHHRVKNNMAVVSGLLEIQAMNTEDADLRNILRESQMRIHSMAMIHEKLYASKSLAAIEFDEYAKELVEVIVNTVKDINTKVEIRYRMDSDELNINQAIPCGLILNELIVNCYKHAFANRNAGSIMIGFTVNEDNVVLTVEDNGLGLPDNFDTQKQQSLGMKIIQTLSHQLEGSIRFSSGEDRSGTCFTLSFKKMA